MVQYPPYMRHILRPAIQWLENLLKVDVRYLTKASSFLLAPQLINAVFAGVASVILANILSANDFGTYKYIIAVAGVFGAFSLNSAGTALTRAIARGFKGTVRPILKASLLVSLLPAFAALAGAAYYALKGDWLFFGMFVVLAIATPVLKGLSWNAAVHEGYSDFRGSATVDGIRAIISGAALICAALLSVPLFFIVATYFFSHAIGALGGLWYTVVRHPIPKDAPEDREAVRYAVHLSVMDLFSIVGSTIDSVIIFQLVGSEGLAIYSIALILPAYLSSPFRNLRKIALPRLSEKTDVESPWSFMRKEGLVVGVAAIVALGYIITAPFAMGILFPKYPESVLYSQVYMLMLLLNGSLIAAHLDSRALIKEKYALKAGVAISRLILLFPLISLFGVWGAIAAQLSTYLLGYVLGNALVIHAIIKERQALGK